MGYTKNSIALHAPIDVVFEITNQIENWKDLFSEYAESTVLERGENWIRFRLTTHPNEDGKVYSWQSRRFIDKDNYQATAEREDPKFPFASMRIKWTYEPAPEGTLMTWIQEFTMDPAASLSEQQMEDYLNRTTKDQQII
ncbi:MAG: SRPBCC family protein [Gammaproteobacteria bacterium]|nr:SRPBCC family protein [Gammaproteobacteria bacterium]